jgi:hypothetical protein
MLALYVFIISIHSLTAAALAGLFIYIHFGEGGVYDRDKLIIRLEMMTA